MLNGIGGTTIAEAQANMSYPEFMVWCKFRGKRGSLHTGMRIDSAIARLASIYWNGKYSNPRPWTEFSPFADQPVPTLEEAQQSWR